MQVLSFAVIFLIAAMFTCPPASAGNIQWTQYSKPFDLVWDPHSEDLNGLPVNPQWAFQVRNPGKLPDFATTCGSAFNVSNNTEDLQQLEKVCTLQHTNLDLDRSSFRGAAWPWDSGNGYCETSQTVLSGHLTWGPATFIGKIVWEGWSGNGIGGDGDYNMLMYPDQYAPHYRPAFTNSNWSPDGEYGLGLEFNDYETVDNAAGAFWKDLVNRAENGAGNPADLFNAPDGAATSSEFGLFGVVIGMIGIDGVHGAYSEVHPWSSPLLNRTQSLK